MAPEEPTGGAGASGSSNGGGGSSGNDSNGGNGAGGRPIDPIDGIPGVTTPDVPPVGCLNAASATALALSLDADVPSVLIEATDGTLHANGVACTDASGADIPVATLTSLGVSSAGTPESGAILDLGSGDWSALLELPEAIAIEFESGPNNLNGLVVRGTPAADVFRHGMRGTELVLDLVGDGRINLVATGVTGLGLSLGAGDDRVDDLAALLAERAAAEEGGEEGAEEGEEPEVPVTTLNLALTATGGDGNDWLLGGLQGDQFDGGAGADVMSGFDGNDAMYSDEMDGADIFNGGSGYDEASYDQRTNDLSIELCVSGAVIGCSAGDCSCSVMSGEAGEEDRLVNVDDVTAGSGNDILRGSEAADSLSGGPGDDDIFGLGGSDLLYGQGGDDLLDGGPDGDYCGATGADQAIGCEL